MREVMDLYLAKRKAEVQPNTYSVIKANCEVLLRHYMAFGYESWEQLDHEFCKEFQEARRELEAPFSTWQTLIELKAFATWLVQNKMFSVLPTPYPWHGKKPIKPRRGTPTVDDISDLIQKAKANTNTIPGFRNYAILRLMLTTGMRSMEVREIEIDQWTTDLVQATGKQRAVRAIPVDELTAQILTIWQNEYRPLWLGDKHECTKLFPSRLGGTLNPKQLNRIFKVQLGTTLDPSHLRHFFASQLELAGCGIEDLKRLMGHSYASNSRQFYSSLSPSEIRMIRMQFPVGAYFDHSTPENHIKVHQK